VRVTADAGGTDIFVINADGTGEARLTTTPGGDFSPDWSPDGQRIVFTSDRDANREIYVMNADGSGQVRLTNDPAFDDAAAFSPDGARIAFHSLRGAEFLDLFVMNADGTDATRLTSNPGRDVRPRWSPDGAWIAYHRDNGVSSAADIYIIAVDGSVAPIQVTDNSAFDGFVDWRRRLP
jgi:Tol biopolymer transport system component